MTYFLRPRSTISRRAAGSFETLLPQNLHQNRRWRTLTAIRKDTFYQTGKNEWLQVDIFNRQPGGSLSDYYWWRHSGEALCVSAVYEYTQPISMMVQSEWFAAYGRNKYHPFSWLTGASMSDRPLFADGNDQVRTNACTLTDPIWGHNSWRSSIWIW